MSGSAILVFLAMAGLMAISAYFVGKRRREIGAWAKQKGLVFSSRADRSFDRQYHEFGCLSRGHSRSAYNIASGPWNGRSLESFDYRYVTGHGKNRSTHTFSAIILESGVPLHPLHIRPETAFDKMTAFLGVEDINFESAQFSKEFYVKSPDKKWAYDVLHQRTIEFLLARPKFSVQFGRKHVICWRNRRFNTQVREEAISVVEGILDRLPEYVVRGQKKGET
jgi:hypothetical protein